VVVNLKKQKKVNPIFVPKNRSGLTPDKRLEITSNSPINSFAKDSISVMNLADSSSVSFNVSIKNHNKLLLDFKPEYKHKYAIQLLPGSITNFFDEVNDTIMFVSSVKAQTEYGEIIFRIKNVASYPIIVDLIDEKGVKIYNTVIAKKEQDFVFSNLTPGKYRIRLIYDKNGNERWDPGNYLKKKMPEEVKYFPEVMDIKANWNIEQDWVLLKE